jgi:lysophospholipase L1-like esterase
VVLKRTRLCAVAAAVLVSILGSLQPARAAELPNSMAATGDSITRGFDADWGQCFLSDCPQYSWSTGDAPEIASHYLRILAGNPAIQGRAFNDAQTGARMNDLRRQLILAAGQGVDYVTIAIGANDVCTRTSAEMTPTDVMRAQLQQALADFTAAKPGALIYLSSIPNVYQLWSVLHTNFLARLTWSIFGICQSMLSDSNTEADRQVVVARLVADNQALAEVCAGFAACLWDNLAAYNFAFTPDDISTVDYFHPSLQGQWNIAALTWAAGYWPN